MGAINVASNNILVIKYETSYQEGATYNPRLRHVIK